MRTFNMGHRNGAGRPVQEIQEGADAHRSARARRSYTIGRIVKGDRKGDCIRDVAGSRCGISFLALVCAGLFGRTNKGQTRLPRACAIQGQSWGDFEVTLDTVHARLATSCPTF